MFRKQGDIGVAYAIMHYTRLGYSVSIPISEATKYDLLIDTDNMIHRVQVKTTGSRSRFAEGYIATLCTTGGNKSGIGKKSFIDSQYVDLVFIYAIDGSLWEFPSAYCHGKTTIALTEYNSNYKIL